MVLVPPFGSTRILLAPVRKVGLGVNVWSEVPMELPLISKVPPLKPKVLVLSMMFDTGAPA